MNIKDKVTEHLLRYTQIMTPSNEESDTVPSSRCQFTLANVLVAELRAMGVNTAYVDEKCYVYAQIPATPGYEDRKAIGFIAHMDTVSEYTDSQVHPLLHEDYDGENLSLPSGLVLDKKDFPHLPALAGRTLITTDGSTVLGADDKAGVSEIMTMAEEILQSGMPHGRICIGFTPDEEIGRGADHFDIAGFGADYAFTVDGGEEGCIEYENFNAASADIYIQGKSVHPGDAKDVMINALLVAMEFNGMLSGMDTPGMTCGYEGFYHLHTMTGSCGEAHLSYIVRDHSAMEYQKKLDYLNYVTETVNQVYGQGTARCQIEEQYRNMREQIAPHMHLIDTAIEATREAGVEAQIIPIRGGTDGARLSYMGLPCPNLGTGGYAFHGPYEHITAEGMEKVVHILINIVSKYAE